MILVKRARLCLPQIAVFLSVLIGCASAFAVDNPTNSPSVDVPKLLESGKACLKSAEQAKTPKETIQNYEKANELFSQAAKLAPDSYRVRYLWGHGLVGLALHTGNNDQRRVYVLQARDQFVAGAKCAGVEWPLYQEWGGMLTREIDLLSANPAERRQILQEAINALNAGGNLARFTGDKAKLDRDLGTAYLLMAKSSAPGPNQRTFYKQAIEKFESATKVESEARTARIYGLWGVALLELGRSNNDRMLMRQATERMQTALEMDPTNPEVRYNLACTYALLDQPEQGIRHLRICLENDKDHTYYNAAAKDPDLDNLRRTAEYNQLLPDDASVDPQTIIRSQISDH